MKMKNTLNKQINGDPWISIGIAVRERISDIILPYNIWSEIGDAKSVFAKSVSVTIKANVQDVITFDEKIYNIRIN